MLKVLLSIVAILSNPATAADYSRDIGNDCSFLGDVAATDLAYQYCGISTAASRQNYSKSCSAKAKQVCKSKLASTVKATCKTSSKLQVASDCSRMVTWLTRDGEEAYEEEDMAKVSRNLRRP
ncbi:hypothetical protein ACHAWX_000558 [Stephanocyclus meneghinianus]